MAKKAVIAEGWCRNFRCCKRSIEVIPCDNEGAEERVASSPSKVLPVQTISENISSLEK